MKQYYTFIGNENDPLTKKWGLKKGKKYEINAIAFAKKPTLIIRLDNGTDQVCPYDTVDAFNKNWE